MRSAGIDVVCSRRAGLKTMGWSALGLVLPGMAISRPTIVYFYSPETNINNFRSLKEEFDSFLLASGCTFQPFSEKEIFEKVISGKKDAVLILSTWHYRKLRESIPIRPVLVGRWQNRNTQKRVLSADKSLASVESLAGETIASAGIEEYTRNLLVEMLGPSQRRVAESLRVLIVPKDIDALMAVGFKMAKAALTTDDSVANLERLHSKLFSQIGILASSKETLLPIVAVSSERDNQTQDLLAVFRSMGNKPEGQRILKMIRLDGFQPLTLNEEQLMIR
jgi:hypothetical protein